MSDFGSYLQDGLSQGCEKTSLMFVLIPITSLINMNNLPLFIVSQALFWVLVFLPVKTIVTKYNDGKQLGSVDKSWNLNVLSLFISFLVYNVIYFMALLSYYGFGKCIDGDNFTAPDVNVNLNPDDILSVTGLKNSWVA